MPLVLDIYVRSLQLKGSKHRVAASTKSNGTAVLNEAKLASCRGISRNSQHAGAFYLVVLEHLERHIRLGKAEGHRTRANRYLARKPQELFAVGARVSRHAAKFFFVEEMLFVVQRRN